MNCENPATSEVCSMLTKLSYQYHLNKTLPMLFLETRKNGTSCPDNATFCAPYFLHDLPAYVRVEGFRSYLNLSCPAKGKYKIND